MERIIPISSHCVCVRVNNPPQAGCQGLIGYANCDALGASRQTEATMNVIDALYDRI